MNENRNLLGTQKAGGVATFVAWLLVAVAALLPAHDAWAAVVVRVSTNDALPGGALTLQMRVDRSDGDPPIAGIQADLILSSEQLNLTGACSSDQSACENGTACPDQGRCVPTCQADTRLTQHSLAAAFPDFQNVPTGRRRLRLPINPELFPPPTLSDGLLVTCTFDVLPGASLGAIELTADLSRFRVTDDVADPVTSTLEIEVGSIVAVLSTVTPTATQTPTSPSATPTVEEPTATPSNEPTASPTESMATETPGGEATQTPTETPPTPATATPSIPISTPTNTALMVTVTPSRTATTEVTATAPIPATPTITATSVLPSVTPTGGQSGGGHNDDDGCNLAANGTGSDARRGARAVLLLLPILALLSGRRRSLHGSMY